MCVEQMLVGSCECMLPRRVCAMLPGEIMALSGEQCEREHTQSCRRKRQVSGRWWWRMGFSVHAHMPVVGTCLLRQHVTPCRCGFQQGARVEKRQQDEPHQISSCMMHSGDLCRDKTGGF